MDPFSYVASTTDMLASAYFSLFGDMITSYTQVILPIVIVVGLVTFGWGYLQRLTHAR